MDVVATGAWHYDDAVSMPVQVVRLDYDFWYAIAEADETLEPGEVPGLNDDGYLFYVRFQTANAEGTTPSFWPDSPGFASAVDAKLSAEARVPNPITWRPPPPSPGRART